MINGHKIAYAVGGVLLLGLGGAILYVPNGYNNYRHFRVEKNDLVKENRAAEEENRQLRRLADRLDTDLGYIQYIARKELGMISADETIYIPRPQEAAP